MSDVVYNLKDTFLYSLWFLKFKYNPFLMETTRNKTQDQHTTGKKVCCQLGLNVPNCLKSYYSLITVEIDLSPEESSARTEIETRPPKCREILEILFLNKTSDQNLKQNPTTGDLTTTGNRIARSLLPLLLLLSFKSSRALCRHLRSTANR